MRHSPSEMLSPHKLAITGALTGHVPTFTRFMPLPNISPDGPLLPLTRYLVCQSAASYGNPRPNFYYVDRHIYYIYLQTSACGTIQKILILNSDKHKGLATGVGHCDNVKCNEWDTK